MSARTRFCAAVLGCAGLLMLGAVKIEAYALGHGLRFSTVLNHAADRTWRDAYDNRRLTVVVLVLLLMLVGLLGLGAVRVGEWVDHRAERMRRRRDLRAARAVRVAEVLRAPQHEIDRCFEREAFHWEAELESGADDDADSDPHHL